MLTELAFSEQPSSKIVSTEKLFSERIKKLRGDMGLGQTEFAKLLRISRNYVSMLEGGREPSSVLLAHFDRVEQDFELQRLKDQRDQAHQKILLREDPAAYVTGARAKLKTAREAKGMTQAALAKAIGYKDPSTYINIEEGRSQMGEKMIKKAAKILGLDESDLMSSEHLVDRNPDKGTFGAIPEINLPPGMTAKYVPLLSLAQCGPNMTWTDDGYTGDGVLAIDCKDPKAFAVKLSGDSMSPKYDPGDTAIIYPSFTPRNGDLVLARLHDEYGGDVMIKLYQSSADSVTLSSYNPVYQPTSFPREAFAILYPVIQITKKLR